MTDDARPNVRSPKRAEAWAKRALARLGQPPRGLLQTYKGDNLAPIAIPPAVLTTLVTIAGIVPTDGAEKFIIHATAFYQAGAGGVPGRIFTAVDVSEDGGPFVPVDGTGDTFAPGAIGTVTRSFEVVGVMGPPHTYVVRLASEIAPGGITGATVIAVPTPGARLTIERVNV